MRDVERDKAAIERIKAYVERHPVPFTTHSCAGAMDMAAIYNEMEGINAILLAYRYGAVHGYRLAKREHR